MNKEEREKFTKLISVADEINEVLAKVQAEYNDYPIVGSLVYVTALQFVVNNDSLDELKHQIEIMYSLSNQIENANKRLQQKWD